MKLINKAAIAVTVGLMATAAQSAQDLPVTVYFEGQCPVGVQPETVDVSKPAGDKVTWTAYDAATGQPAGIVYEVFFDPFKGKSIVSGTDGVAQSKKVADDVPINVEFKYTIYSPTCPEAPLDPRIMIR